ncbi:MAG: hypothetical protein K1000chlam3_00368 [Chlamydiae bacterium]|nr:hypothetical protein [Chlamydiota bacterium]
MRESLTHLEAFKAMRCFLEKYYEQTSSDDIGSLLGEMQILEAHRRADPAAWEDWTNCIKKIISRDS